MIRRLTALVFVPFLAAFDLLLAAAPPPAEAHGGEAGVVHVCLMRRGLPRFVTPLERCRPTETATHWPFSALETPGSVQAVDSRGVVIGPVIGVTTRSVQGAELLDFMTVIRFGDLALPLKVGRDRFRTSTQMAPLWYESDNCTGTPFFDRASVALNAAPVVAISAPGMTLYIPDDAATYTVRPHRSQRDFLGDCNPTNSNGLVAPAVPVVDLSGLFIPPFSLR